MKNQQLKELFNRYLENRCSVQELEMLARFFHTDDEIFLRDLIYQELSTIDEDVRDSRLQFLSDSVFKEIQVNINKAEQIEFNQAKKQNQINKPEEQNEINEPTGQNEQRTMKLWSGLSQRKFVGIAAAILLVIGAGLFFYNRYANTSRRPELVSEPPIYVNDIKPGGNKAYLTLANGKRLSLTDAANGTVAKEAGVEITKTADGQVIYTAPDTNYLNALNTIETPRGGQYQVRLPDGSKVWLNAASKLIYPVSFKGRERREVSLTGEAYFEIFKSKLQPFVVKSKNQEVTVLGTHFNINSYADEEKTKTTLLEGSVLVSTPSLRGGTTKQSQPQISKEVASSLRFPRNDDGTILKPGQQSVLIGNTIKITRVNAEDAAAWKDGEFRFSSEEISSIMRKVARWYNVQIIYKDNVGQIKLTGSVSRFENLSKLLEMLENTKEVHFKTEGGKVTITK